MFTRTMKEIMKDIHDWAFKTFGVINPQPKLYHLKEEVKELIEACDKHNDEEIRMEFADCFILLFNAATVYGLSFDDIKVLMEKKMEINKNRTWKKADENGVSKHIFDPAVDDSNLI